jgi:chemotaxis protein methyltransferase CheR
VTITTSDFDYIRAFVRERSAIVLEPGKEYLVESRLKPLARELGVATIDELVAQMRTGRVDLERAVVEAMTTNETSWFRDHHPFEMLKAHVLPELIAARRARRELHIWSAACSTGQEPYSLVMLLRDSFPELGGWDVRILATDLSTEVLERAREGKYAQLEANRGLPAPMLVKWFERAGMGWQVTPAIRDAVEFRQLNLVHPWPAIGTFDLVLLRNVLIYFDLETKRDVLERVHGALSPDGFLLLGAAETTINAHDGFERVAFDRAGILRRTTPGRGRLPTVPSPASRATPPL